MKSGWYETGATIYYPWITSIARSPVKDIIRLDSPYRFWAVQASNASGTRLSLLSGRLSACVHAHSVDVRAYFKRRSWLMRRCRARVCVRASRFIRVGLERARHGFARVYRAYESCDLAHALYACLHAPTVARLHRDDAYSSQLFRPSRFDRDQTPLLLREDSGLERNERKNICLWIFSLPVKKPLVDSYFRI